MWRACQQLHSALAGKPLTRSEFRVPQLATTDLTGVSVVEVVARGKHQLLRFDNDFTLHTHLRMGGSWRIYQRDAPWSGGRAFQIRVVLGTEERNVIGYRLPVVEMVATADEESVVGHLGPDLLGPDVDLAEVVRRVSAQPGRTIGEALLDQRNLPVSARSTALKCCSCKGSILVLRFKTSPTWPGSASGPSSC